jgi:hypothetical protein
MDWTSALQRLKADKGNWAVIARETKLHPNGIRRIAAGGTEHPRIDTAQKIIDYYASRVA